MYKILVVDDEPIVRLALKSLANWESNGFDLGFEASNGKQALEILVKNPDIDIIITDINMPVMDGLELISRVRETGSNCHIVVLSAYDEYNLVRQAFKLGAKDYILKNDMDPENILKILESIKPDLKYSAGAISDRGIDKNLAKEKLLRELIEEDEVPELETRSESLNISYEKNIVVCCLLIDDYQAVCERYDGNNLKLFAASVKNGIYQILGETKTGEALIITPKEYCIIFSFESMNLIQVREKVLEILGRIKYSLRNYININVSIGVSSMKPGLASAKQLFKEAETNAGLRFVLGKGRIIFPESAESMVRKDINTIIGKDNNLVSALKEVNKDKMTEEIGKLLECVKNGDVGRIDEIYACYMEIIYFFINFMKERNEDIAVVLGENINFYNTITRFETQDEINRWIKSISETIIDYLTDKKDMKVNRAIIRVQEFVKDNYNNDITLKTVSDYVGLSESHLSYIFTKMTGETFTDYLTRIRIEKAKTLLETTNMKVYEVSVNVGYANAEHFSRVFKRITGRSPNNYKNI